MKEVITAAIFTGLFCTSLTGCADREKSTEHTEKETVVTAPDRIRFMCTEKFDAYEPEATMHMISADEATGTKSYVEKGLEWNTLDLKVQFLDGDTTVIRRVKETAKQWEQVCGIRFKYGEFTKPDITISFKDKANDSYIGKASRRHRPSMRFGWLSPTTEQEEYDRVVLHEFGHALGMVHEHLVENAPIIWDSEVVYQYYADSPDFWSRGKVDSNIFWRYSMSQLNGTTFDSNSIMIYWIDTSWTKNGFFVQPKTKISAEDAKLMSKIYKRR